MATKELEAIRKIEEAAELASVNLRDATYLAIHDGIRQGDVYLWRMPEGTPLGKAIVRPNKGNYQIVQGSTQGARHIIEGDFMVYERHASCVPKHVWDNALYGSTLVVGAKGAVVTHPEHAHVKLGKGCWQSVHQMDDQTRKRVED